MNPSLILKFIGSSVGLTGGITGSIFSSFQAFTRAKIEDLLKDDLFNASDSSSSDVWKILQKKLDDAQNQNEKVLELSKLKDSKKPTSGDTASYENGQKLKSWCEEIKNTKVKKFLSSNYETILLNYVRDFCVITIGEKIKKENQFTSLKENETILTTNIQNLNSHAEDSNGDLSKEPKLNKIKSKNSGKKEALLSWCLSSYKKTYKNSEDNLWKLTNRYCNKTTQAS